MSRTPTRRPDREVDELRREIAALNGRVDELTDLLQRTQVELFRRIAELHRGGPVDNLEHVGHVADDGARRDVAATKAQDYARLVVRVQAAVVTAVPAGSVVAVVSRGDDALVTFDERVGRHFPCVDDGRYAGHHPRDDEAAIAHLDAQRAAGVTHLVFPATARWWLEHYRGLRRHLETTARLVLHHPDTCVIYALI